MRHKRIIVYLIVVIGIATTTGFIIKLISNDLKLRKKFKMEEFNGKITGLKFDSKHFPTVIIENKSYYLGNSTSDFGDIIKVNDSIVKRSNKVGYLLYRKNADSVWQLIYGDYSE